MTKVVKEPFLKRFHPNFSFSWPKTKIGSLLYSSTSVSFARVAVVALARAMHYSCCCWLFSKSNFVSFVCFGKLVKIDRYQLSKLWRRSKIAFLLKPSAAKIWDRFGGPTLLCRMSGAEQRRAAFWQMSRLLLLSKLLRRRLSAIVSDIYEILNIIDSFLIFVPFSVSGCVLLP